MVPSRCSLLPGRIAPVLAALLAATTALLLAACTPSTPAPAATPVPPGSTITVPAGFEARPWVTEGLAAPTAMAFGPGGDLYVAQLAGRISVIPAPGPDGTPGTPRVWLTDLFSPLGLAWIGDTLYISGQNRLIAARDLNANGIAEWINGDGVAEVREVYTDLGVADGQHQNNNLAVGPDGAIYVGVGGICNVCVQPNPYAGSILRLDPDGRTPPEVWATGFRNAFGVAFDEHGQLWATENGADPPVIENAPDELNLVVRGGFYGYPWHIDGSTPGPGMVAPTVLFPPHSSANTIVFYQGTAAPALRGQALVAYFGPDLRRSADSHKVVSVDLSRPGDPVIRDFATGFDRPLAMAEGPDGAIYVGDFSGGRIWRISPAG